MKRASLVGSALIVLLTACGTNSSTPTPSTQQPSLAQKLSGTWTGTTTTDYGVQQTEIGFNNNRYADGSFEISGGMKLVGGETATAQTEVVDVQVTIEKEEAILNACVDPCTDDGIDGDDVLYTYLGTLSGDTLSGTVLVAVGGTTIGKEGTFSLTQDPKTVSD